MGNNSTKKTTAEADILSTNQANPRSMCKGKAIPLQTWTGPEVYRSLRLSDFKKIDT